MGGGGDAYFQAAWYWLRAVLWEVGATTSATNGFKARQVRVQPWRAYSHAHAHTITHSNAHTHTHSNAHVHTLRLREDRVVALPAPSLVSSACAPLPRRAPCTCAPVRTVRWCSLLPPS